MLVLSNFSASWAELAPIFWKRPKVIELLHQP